MFLRQSDYYHKGLCKNHRERSESGFLIAAPPSGITAGNPSLSAIKNPDQMGFAETRW